MGSTFIMHGRYKVLVNICAVKRLLLIQTKKKLIDTVGTSTIYIYTYFLNLSNLISFGIETYLTTYRLFLVLQFLVTKIFFHS